MRYVSETRAGAWVGTGLVGRAAAGGARALGRASGESAVGRRADLVALDTGHPTLVGRAGDRLLDAWVFAGNATPVCHVMVAGRWRVRDGRHADAERIAAAFARTMRRLAARA